MALLVIIAFLIEPLAVGGIGVIAAICIGSPFAEVAYCAGDKQCVGEVVGFWGLFMLPVSTAVAFAIDLSGFAALNRLKR